MPDYVFTLEPEKKVEVEINNIKNRLFREEGEQLYLLHPPHITLYLGNLNVINKNNFNYFFKKIKDKYSPVKVKIKAVKSFEKDPITGLKNFYFEITDNEKKLYQIQRETWDIFKRYKTKKVHKIYNENKERIPNFLRKNIDQYGYAFFGNIWIPHLSIGSFDRDITKKIKKITKDFKFGEYELDKLAVYEYLGKDKMHLIEKFNLNFNQKRL